MTPADRATWQLAGSDRQQRIAAEALARCDYPFEVLKPGLRQQTGRERIPCEWDDLSRYAAARSADDHMHDHDHGDYHALEVRRRVLGLAWYSGKVTLDTSLEHDSELAAEILLSEGAHMCDFFAASDAQRAEIFAAFHGGDTTEHGHDWFDVGTYREEVGEAFMGGFVRAFAPSVPVTIDFAHPASEAVGRAIREVLLRDVVFGLQRSAVVHDAHRGIARERHWPDREAAVVEGRRGCRVCKP